MAKLSNGTIITFSTVATTATNCRVSSSRSAVDLTALNDVLTTAIGGRATVTGSATIFCDQAPALTLAQLFTEGTPSGAAIGIVITSPVTGLVYSGNAFITGFNPTWDSDGVMTAEVSWQYTGQITTTRPTS